ncbi:hypothetical protein BH20ACI4_BH20ACI4_16710 [soil metagenome]
MKFRKLVYILFLFLFLFLSDLSQIFAQDFNRQRTYDVQHYKIQVKFDREKQIVFGDTTVSLKPLTDNFNTVELDAAEIKFDSVILENENKILSYKLDKDRIIIELGKSFKSKDLIKIRFTYSCKPKKGIYFVPEKKEGRKIVHSEQIWTQGEPDEARFWFPSYDFPDDKATSELFITAKSDENVISNGEFIEQTETGDGTAVHHYKMMIPHSTYLVSFVIGKYSKTTDLYQNIPLGIYVYPGEESVIPLAFSDTKDMFRIFENVTGVNYPFNKYDQTIVSNFSFGGMENVTATTFSDKEIFLARFAHLRGFAIDLVSHELAHSWFGNLVTCRNWAELWLNEGFATYMEAVYRGKMYGTGAYTSKIREDANIYLYGDAVNNYKHGLFNQTANNTDKLFKYPNITYNKGSLVIHLLRETVGEDAFWKAVNIYLNRHKFSNVETNDLKKIMEEVSGKNLDTFFKQWVHGIGHPKLEIEPVYNSRNKKLNLTISQTQKGDKVHEVFSFPMEIFIQTENGEQMERVLVDKRNQTLSFDLTKNPLEIILDKNTKMPVFEAKINKIKIN